MQKLAHQTLVKIQYIATLSILLAITTPTATLATGSCPLNPSNCFPNIIGSQEIYTTKYRDSLVDLARTHRLGYTEIIAANPGIDPWVPGANKKILLPKAHIVPSGPREGILINLADQRLYFFSPNSKKIWTAPLGIGNEGWDTPKGSTKGIKKKRNPTWFVPASVRLDQPELPPIIGPGPKNPLGKYAVYLGWPAYLFHGTNKPYGVGRRVSHGCVRLYPEDIAKIFPEIKIGMPVNIIDQPMKLLRQSSELWLEIHPNQKQADELERSGKLTPTKPPEFEYRLIKAAGNLANYINWPAAKEAAQDRKGIPIQIFRKTNK